MFLSQSGGFPASGHSALCGRDFLDAWAEYYEPAQPTMITKSLFADMLELGRHASAKPSSNRLAAAMATAAHPGRLDDVWGQQSETQHGLT